MKLAVAIFIVAGVLFVRNLRPSKVEDQSIVSAPVLKVEKKLAPKPAVKEDFDAKTPVELVKEDGFDVKGCVEVSVEQ